MRRTLAPALALAGGVGAIAGSFLGWAELSVGPVAQQAKGVDGWEGKLAVVGGAILLIPAIRAFAGAPDAFRGLRSGVLGGLLAAGPALYDAFTLNEQFLAAATEAGIPESVAREAVESGRLEVSLLPGLWLVVIAGVLGIVAGVLVLTSGRAEAAPPADGPAGLGLRGWQSPLGSEDGPAGRMPAEDPPGPVPSPWASPPSDAPPRPDAPPEP